jgi:Mrp family chromosome partitioning ATPase
VILAGAQPGDAACSLAVLVAREIHETCGLRPLLLELSRAPSVLASWFDLDDDRTLRAVASGRVSPLDAVQPIDGGVGVIPAGPSASTTGDEPELGVALGRVLVELEGAFDVVIVVTPALPTQAEALQAAPAVPRALLVAESGRARIEVLARAKADLTVAGAQLLGAVLTDHRREVPGWVYRLLVGRP